MAFPGMSQAVDCGDQVIVSGQVAWQDGRLIGGDDAEAQAEQCFANLARVLEAAGLGLADVVLLRCYLTRADAYAGYAAVKKRLMGEIRPASTAVVVQALLLPGLLMELEAVARRRPG
jgi:enamine deaminase RidA (YjgF/YER057c/UK114 family)